MGAFEGGDYALGAAEKLKGIKGLFVACADVLAPAALLQRGVGRAYRRVVESGGNGIYLRGFTLFICENVAFKAVHDSRGTLCQTGCVISVGQTSSGGFDPDKPNFRVFYEGCEGADGVAPAADTCDDRVGKGAGPLDHLGPGLFAYYLLKILDYGRVGVGAYG